MRPCYPTHRGVGWHTSRAFRRTRSFGYDRSRSRDPAMTVQMNDLAARQSPDGWAMAWVPHGGNSRIHLLDARGNTSRSFQLASSLPDFSRFAHWTTAGMDW